MVLNAGCILIRWCTLFTIPKFFYMIYMKILQFISTISVSTSAMSPAAYITGMQFISTKRDNCAYKTVLCINVSTSI